jgi:uncharacterized protein (TIGR02145 family)
MKQLLFVDTNFPSKYLIKLKIYSFLFAAMVFFLNDSIRAQNVGVGTNMPHSSAQLDVTSNNRGFLPPRMTFAQRIAITNPAAGLIVFCTDCGLNGEMQFYNGIQWSNMAIGAGYGSLVTDTSGNTYNTVHIGTQIWMAENLRTTKYNDGSNIPIVSNAAQWENNWNSGDHLQLPMMCWYNNEPATYVYNKFGALYNWYAINPATNGNKNVCPTGWHVPTDAEWTTLINFLDSNANGGNNPNTAGGKMKSTGTQFWGIPNAEATNLSGWSGLPAGFRSDLGGFNSVGYFGTWLSSSEYSTVDAWYRYLGYGAGDASRAYGGKTSGQSVRCLKD